MAHQQHDLERPEHSPQGEPGFRHPHGNAGGNNPPEAQSSAQEAGGDLDASGNPRGFAAMDEDKQRQIASKGGAAVSRNREYMAAIGRKGGERVSQNREHMASIGKRGGVRVSQNREHMAKIGRKGGERVSQDREHMSKIGRKGGES